MHRLARSSRPSAVLNLARGAVVSSIRVVRTINRPLHLVVSRRTGPAYWNSGIIICQTRIWTQFQNGYAFSTDTSSSGADEGNNEVSPDLSKLSHRDLEQLALKYARQTNPTRAQWVLDRLVEARQEASGRGGGDDSSLPSQEELAIVRTSVVDAWFEYQKKKIDLLEECVRQGDSLSILRQRMEEICHAAESASELIEPELNQANVKHVISSHHVLAILKAWANACEASRVAGLTAKSGDWSGIPQRAQYILSTYLTATGNKPSAELVNQVLKAWAYSGEHLRGTMAEQAFQQYFQGIKQETNLPSANGETFRFMIQAWGWSKEKRCAFTATGHFMRMMRLLEIGQLDMEPTLEDYRILFQTWTTAE